VKGFLLVISRSSKDHSTTMQSQIESKCQGEDYRAGSNDARVPRAKRHPREHRTAVPEEKLSKKVILTSPLSICTAHLVHIPLEDIEAWVARPASLRHQEANNRGRIKRPLNCFLLYRKAFMERTRAYFAQKKQQNLSQVIATSWNMESDDVQQRYQQYAKEERLNHTKAHPTYKFSPCRPHSDSRKGQERFLEEQRSDLPLECNEQGQPLTTTNTKTTDDCVFRTSDSPSQVTPQPIPVEAMIGLSHYQYQYQRCYWSEYDGAVRYYSEQAFSPMDTLMGNSYGAHGGTYYGSPDGSSCVYFPCVHYGQSTSMGDNEYSIPRSDQLE
jgi:hypothetical protein